MCNCTVDYESTSLLNSAAISRSLPFAMCWYRIAAAGVECPRRAISRRARRQSPRPAPHRNAADRASTGRAVRRSYAPVTNTDIGATNSGDAYRRAPTEIAANHARAQHIRQDVIRRLEVDAAGSRHLARPPPTLVRR